MATAAEMIEAAMPELWTRIGRREVVEDEIGLTTVRRIAAMLDQEPSRTVAIEHFDAVYREGPAPGEKHLHSKAASQPCDAAWSKTFDLSNTLVFLYSAITWNAHRIHYDADYARREERYPQAVQNGGLTMQLIIDAALPHRTGRLTGFKARFTRPLWVGDRVTVRGGAAYNGRMSCWGADKGGHQCAVVDVEYGE